MSTPTDKNLVDVVANLEGERTGVGLTPRLVKKISNPTVEDHFRESVILKGYVPFSEYYSNMSS